MASAHRPQQEQRPAIFTLPTRAVQILRAQVAHNDDLGYDGGKVFTNDGYRPVMLGSRVKDDLIAKAGITGWRFHDMRRTFATELCERGQSGEVVDMMLNHRASASRGGVAGVYNRSVRLEAVVVSPGCGGVFDPTQPPCQFDLGAESGFGRNQASTPLRV